MKHNNISVGDIDFYEGYENIVKVELPYFYRLDFSTNKRITKKEYIDILNKVVNELNSNNFKK